MYSSQLAIGPTATSTSARRSGRMPFRRWNWRSPSGITGAMRPHRSATASAYRNTDSSLRCLRAHSLSRVVWASCRSECEKRRPNDGGLARIAVAELACAVQDERRAGVHAPVFRRGGWCALKYAALVQFPEPQPTRL